jgi:tetratricopeptide (TPR) repeat protein
MVHYSLAVVCNLIGETDDAFKHYNEAIRLNPEFAKAHSNLAMLSYSLKRGKETIHHLLKAVEMFKKTGDEFMINNAKSLLKDCFKEFNLTAEECQTL